MDISFEIRNNEGDQLRVALSYYDSEVVRIFSSDPQTLTLYFYDVTLVREAGDGYVGYNVLSAVSDTLAKFMFENDDVILCFYCDADTEIKRNHSVSPQEYRSNLFSRMFEKYTKAHDITEFINYRVRMDVDSNPLKSQFAHFICRKRHERAVRELGTILIGLDK